MRNTGRLSRKPRTQLAGTCELSSATCRGWCAARPRACSRIDPRVARKKHARGTRVSSAITRQSSRGHTRVAAARLSRAARGTFPRITDRRSVCVCAVCFSGASWERRARSSRALREKSARRLTRGYRTRLLVRDLAAVNTRQPTAGTCRWCRA